MNHKDLWKGIALATLMLVGLDALGLGSLRTRALLGIPVLTIGVLVVAQWRRLLGRSPFRWPLATGFVVSVAPVLSLAVLGGDDPFSRVAAQLIPTLTGWCILLALLLFAAGSTDATESGDWSPGRLRGALALGMVFVVLAVAHHFAVGKLAIVADEVVYLTQSRWMRPGQWTPDMEPALAPFFLIRQIGYLDGHLIGQYPPGWPILLAGFRLIGLEWWANVIMGTVSVASIYQVGARLHSKRMGSMAALLLATSQVFWVAHGGYMSHASNMAVLLGGTACMLTGLDRSGWRRMALWVAGGALLGMSVAIRPLTGISLGTSVGLWMMLRAWRVDRRAPLVMAACVIVGGILPGYLFISHNLAVFGEPLTLGYDVIHEGLFRLGFGTHGDMVLDENVKRVAVTFQFTLQDAVRALMARLSGLNTNYVPIGLLVPITAVAVAAGYRISWGVLALFALLPAAHFFYRYASLRMYIELLPFIMLVTAAMLLRIRTRLPRLAAGLLVIVLASQVVVAIPFRDNRRGGYRPWLSSDYGPVAPARRMALMTADSLAKVHGRILLFSREATRYDNLMDRLYQFNGGRFDGPIVVARDRGTLNAELMRRMPDRVPFLVEDKNGDTPAVFTRIDP